LPDNFLSRYELLEEIGRGNMGVVYKARDPDIDRILAIKVVRFGFSLDVILYQLLTGERPFEATTVSRTIYRVLHDEPTPPSRVRPGISPLWDNVCARLLAKKPDDR